MEFRILGPVEARADGGPIDLGRPKQRALLAALLLRSGEAVARDSLVDALWGEEPPASAVQSLQVYVSGLRKALGADRIETRGTSYRVVLDPGELDLERFGNAGRPRRAELGAGHADSAAGLSARRSLWHRAGARRPRRRAARPGERERLEERRPRARALRRGRARASAATTSTGRAGGARRGASVPGELPAVSRCWPHRAGRSRRRWRPTGRLEPRSTSSGSSRSAELRAASSAPSPPPATSSRGRTGRPDELETRPPGAPTALSAGSLEIAAVSALLRHAARLVTPHRPGRDR